MAYDHTHEYAHRYHDAIAGRIRANAATSRRRHWLEVNEDAQEMLDFLSGNYGDGFLGAMNASIDEWGGLTDNQMAAVRKIMAKRTAQATEWSAQDAKSDWVGTVGERQSFALTVKHVVSLDGGNWGTSYINICRDADDNVVIYKGSNCWGKGNAVVCMAKIKEHGVREGVKQNIIQRPTKVTVNGEAW